MPADPAAAQRPAPGFVERGRDLRLDFLRGLCVIGMIVDHVAGPSWLYAITGGNRFYTSAAEGFVFISGLVAGRAYTRFIARSGLGSGLGRLLNRAGQLYLLAVALTLVFAPASEALHLPWAVGWDARSPIEFLVGVITLHRTYYLVDVLSLYVLVLLVSTVIFVLLLRGQTLLVLVGAWLVWLLYQVFPDQVAMPWTIQGNNLFYFAAWQVLFFTGVVIGHHWEQPDGLGNNRWLGRLHRLVATSAQRRRALAIGAGVLAICIVMYALQDWLLGLVFRDAADPAAARAQVLTSVFGKADLRAGRLAVFGLVFGVFFLAVTEWWPALRRWLGWLVLPLGQNALFAYSVHVLIALAVGLSLERMAVSDAVSGAQNAAAQIGAVLVTWCLVQIRPLRALFAWPRVRLGVPALLGIATLLVLPRLPVELTPAPAASASLAATPVSAAAQIAQAYGTVIPPGIEPKLPDSVLAPPVPQDGPTPQATPAAQATAAPQSTAAPQPTPAAASQPQTAANPTALQAVSTAAGPLQGTLLEPTFHATSLNTTERYFVYLPPKYQTSGQRYPVLYLLHGGNGRREWINYGLINDADQAIAAGTLPPLIIVLPQGDNGYWVNHINGGPRWGDYLAQDVVHEIDATFPTMADAKHRAIGGLSMGGWGALYQAFTHPDEFGVVGAHAAALHTDDGSMPFLPRGTGFSQFDPMQLASAAPGLERLRVWLDAGDKDPWVQRDAELHAALDQRHISNEWHEYSGQHGGSYWHDHAQEYLAFYAQALTAP